MSWAKLDDLFDDNRKVKRAFRRCPSAVGVYVMAITYCARHATDGVVDIDWLEERLPATELRAEVVAALTSSGLFEYLPAGETRTIDVEAPTKHAGAHSVQLGPLTDDAYLVHDFLDYNYSSVHAEARRAADAQRKREARERPRGHRKDSGRTPPTETRSPTAPTRTRPDPTPKAPNPPQAGVDDLPPLPPINGNRQRDRTRYGQTVTEYAQRLFPEGPHDLARQAVEQAAQRGHGTPGGIRAHAAEWFPTLTATSPETPA